MRTLIKNGTIVTAVDQYRGDVLVEDEKVTLIGSTLADIHADKVDRRVRQVRPARWHRRAHTPRHAVRRLDVRR